jgi:hypothetical protein
MWRTLGLVVLALAMAGFGICSLCGGVIGISSLSDGQHNGGDIASLAFTCAAVGVVITVLCAWAFRALKRRKSSDE